MRRSPLVAGIALSVTLFASALHAQTLPYGSCPPGTPREQAQHGWQRQSQGHWVEAEACLQSAMAVESDPWVHEHQAQLIPSLHRVSENVGGLQILGGVPGAHVRVDGLEVATLPMDHAIRVEATSIFIEVVADGYRTAERRVDVTAGEHARVETIPLVPQAAAPAPVVVSPVPAPSLPALSPPAASLHVPPNVPHPANESPHPSPLRTAAWVGVAAGGAGIAGGIIALAVRQAQLTLAVSNHCNDELPNDGPGDCSSLHSSIGMLQPLGIVLLVAGAVMGAGGVAALLVVPSQ